jgi:quercetin dioxygenase-like cupin family protein
LIVTAGCGWVQCWGGPVETAPGEKHWHGAKATTSMTHIAIQEALNGKLVDWVEKVGEDQYPSF